MKKPHFTTRRAVAEAYGQDIADVADYHYQPSRTPCPVFTMGDDYVTATSSPDKPPKGNADYVWVKKPSCLNIRFDWQLWINSIK